MAHSTFTHDGHYYSDSGGRIYDSAGQFEGEVFKSACGEYWIYDGDTSGQLHENETDAYAKARLALITGNAY